MCSCYRMSRFTQDYRVVVVGECHVQTSHFVAGSSLCVEEKETCDKKRKVRATGCDGLMAGLERHWRRVGARHPGSDLQIPSYQNNPAASSM